MEVKKIAVIGSGAMGNGIANVGLMAGYTIAMHDIEQRFIDKGVATIKDSLGKFLSKGKITQEQNDSMLANLKPTTDLKAAVADADLVIEAVFENMDLKKKIFADLDAFAPAHTILASNTSTLNIASIAAITKDRTRVIGTHYFSPVPAMRLVEVIVGRETSDETVKKTVDLCKRFGKTPIVVKDIPGFIVNRFLCLLYNEAANMVENGLASPEDIDTALKLGCNWPMGVFEIMDMAGVDVVLFALEAMYGMTNEERYKPSPIFRTMVKENRLGRKTGRGFYEGDKE